MFYVLGFLFKIIILLDGVVVVVKEKFLALKVRILYLFGNGVRVIREFFFVVREFFFDFEFLLGIE